VLGKQGVSRAPRRAAGLATVVLLVLLYPAAVVLAGTPTRGFIARDTSELLTRTPVHIDAATLPAITVTQDVVDFDHSLAGTGIQPVLVTLAQNLEVENQALLRRDPALLAAVDHGDRLTEVQARLADAQASGRTPVRHYDFDAVDVSLIVPFGVQSGLSLGFDGTGTLTEEIYDAAGNLLSTTTEPFDTTFALRRATGARWLIVGENPILKGPPPTP
jgi:hypothetical protein